MTENKDITISVEYEVNGRQRNINLMQLGQGSNEKEEIASAKKEDCHEVPVQG